MTLAKDIPLTILAAVLSLLIALHSSPAMAQQYSASDSRIIRLTSSIVVTFTGFGRWLLLLILDEPGGYGTKVLMCPASRLTVTPVIAGPIQG